ncbi:Uma2 family endonuclease [soil metagenome]
MAQHRKLGELSVDEYLALEDSANVRSEYLDGHIFAMTGATEAHNLISGNLFARLHQHLSGSSCRPFIADMKLYIETANSFYYPDVMVTCEPYIENSVFKKLPVMIAEVLSSSTKHIDRREKLIAYRQIKTLREYLILHQAKLQVEVHRKDPEDKWEVITLGKLDILDFKSFSPSLSIAVADLYEGATIQSTVSEEESDYDASAS